VDKKERPAGRPAYTYIAKGKYWRFRYRGFDAPLPGQPGAPDFEAKYVECLALTIKPAPIAAKPIKGTFDFVMGKFYEDVEFRALATRTQANYLQFGKSVSKYLGDCMMQLTTMEMLAGVRNTMKIGYAEVIRLFISRLYVFAGDRGYVLQGLNPALRMRRIKSRGPGHEPWSHEEIALLFQHATGGIRTLIIIALCTGQRPGDVERMTWSQVLGDVVRVRQRKTNELLTIPMHPVLRAELDRLRAQGPVSGVIVRKRSGGPVGVNGFGYRMKTLVRNIPHMPWRTPHGSRYATAAILRDAGCDVDQICSIIGHRTYEMAMKYLKRRKLAIEAMAMMVRHSALPAPPPPLALAAPVSPARPVTAGTTCKADAAEVICRFQPAAFAEERSLAFIAG